MAAALTGAAPPRAAISALAPVIHFMRRLSTAAFQPTDAAKRDGPLQCSDATGQSRVPDDRRGRRSLGKFDGHFRRLPKRPISSATDGGNFSPAAFV